MTNPRVLKMPETQDAPLSLTLEQIHVDESRNVSRFSPASDADIRALAENIKQYGRLLEPVIVERIIQGISGYPDYQLVAGYNRIRALKLLKSEGVTIPIAATLKPHSADSESVNIDENLERNDLTLMDYARICQNLKSRKLSGGAIAKRLGKKHAWVSVVLSFLKLRPEIQQRIHAGEIGFAQARELVGKTDKQQDRMLEPKPSKLESRKVTVHPRKRRVTVVAGRPEPNLLLTLRGQVNKALEAKRDARVKALRMFLFGRMKLPKLLAAMGAK